ncbi:hypothetical protein VNO80_15774 [Phaseolus coccineus]|uniref:Uncharacterized protein n=1 Tax=Phaseolus coccineus TaxID=3886 RepID=A0AAN9MM87_PHACN
MRYPSFAFADFRFSVSERTVSWTFKILSEPLDISVRKSRSKHSDYNSSSSLYTAPFLSLLSTSPILVKSSSINPMQN